MNKALPLIIEFGTPLLGKIYNDLRFVTSVSSRVYKQI